MNLNLLEIPNRHDINKWIGFSVAFVIFAVAIWPF